MKQLWRLLKFTGQTVVFPEHQSKSIISPSDFKNKEGFKVT